MTARAGRPPQHHLGAVEPRHRATISVEEAGDTPILREYRAVKAAHPDCIVLARLGDFYEMFGEDAEVAAPVLGVALTGRSFGNAGRVPMCGVPHQAAVPHIRKLLAAGHRVALWDQVGDASGGKLVDRRVTRVLSAGTAVDADFLDAASTARCLAIRVTRGLVGVAALDASTGTLELLEHRGNLTDAALADELRRLDAAELVVPDGITVPATLLGGVPRTPLAPSLFDLARADERLLAATGMGALAALDAGDLSVARSAAGAVLAYADRCGIRVPAELLHVRIARDGAHMRLDEHTRRNLELLHPLGGQGVSLVSLLDRTRTAMGARLLRTWLQAPLTDVEAIARRSQAVAELVSATTVRESASDALRVVRDLERLVARCAQGSAGPRDLAMIRDACRALPTLVDVLAALRSPLVAELRERCGAPQDVVDHLERMLVDSPTLDSAGAIRPGFDADLDSLLDAAAGAREYIATLEQRERQRSGIRSLRVGYNRVFGYYLEVPNASRDLVPADYTRKQTLSGVERYVTADLHEQEAIVLHARDRALARERELLDAAARLVAGHAPALGETARALAAIDVLCSLADVAVRERWTPATVDRSEVIDIEQGRHPLVERSLGPGRFVPNDCALDAAARILVLTGPNMAGKSTYLRQVAVITLLAHVGSHVPASRARIGVCDRIFTRIGAHDDLSGGMSTFMLEMAETAAILRQATPRSLVILDEVGRGTSTYDGLSIAQAVVEHLHDAPQLDCRTLFATHYHELTALEAQLCRLRNARVEVEERGDTITFLHRIVPGGADRSYGIHVARLAGIPVSVLLRARTLLDGLERSRPLGRTTAEDPQLSLGLAASPAHPVVAELASLDIDSMSPLSALNALADLRRRAAD